MDGDFRWFILKPKNIKSLGLIFPMSERVQIIAHEILPNEPTSEVGIGLYSQWHNPVIAQKIRSLHNADPWQYWCWVSPQIVMH
jgi:hypothetical protein